MDTFGLKIISSDRVFYEGRCRKMIVPVPDGGGMEILPHHENMVIAVAIGDTKLQFEEGEWVDVAVGTGFLEIVNNRVTMLVQTAEKPEDIDARHAQEQKEYAEERLRQKQSTDHENRWKRICKVSCTCCRHLLCKRDYCTKRICPFW